MIEVDRAMIEDYHIELIQMMENAGRNLAVLARERFFQGNVRGQSITVLAGSGGNGGGALVSARHLHNYGAEVKVYMTKPDAQLTPVTAHQLDILRRMKVPIQLAEAVESAELPNLIIDGIIGYSLRGEPHGPAAKLIQWANRWPSAILSLDAPSGLDSTSGTVNDPTIQAAATMTLALPKVGLLDPAVGHHIGELYVANISVPSRLYAGRGLNISLGPIFSTNDILRIR
jgi:NAD(P)H-hydrate epimerase